MKRDAYPQSLPFINFRATSKGAPSRFPKQFPLPPSSEYLEDEG
jgi:hypothetical protein